MQKPDVKQDTDVRLALLKRDDGEMEGDVDEGDVDPLPPGGAEVEVDPALACEPAPEW
jgi:hypothetical protein